MIGEEDENVELEAPSPAPPVRGPVSAAIFSAMRSLGRGLAAAARLCGVALSAAWFALGKAIITTWRIAAALDSALWRAVKLLFGRVVVGCAVAAGWAFAACRGLLAWLPTRTGRAYSALSGVFLIVAVLWIIDELRAGPVIDVSAQETVRAPIDEEDPILALIEGRYVHLSEIEAAARAGGFLRQEEILTPATAFDRGLVETYVEQRLLARAAVDAGMQRSPSVMRKVNAARDRVLASSFLEARTGEATAPDAVRAFYDRTSDVTRVGDEVRARHILVESEAEAIEVATLLAGGDDFAEIARDRSLDRDTARRGGDVGWFSRDVMEDAFAAAAFATEPGARAAPFESEYGWHVLEVLERRSTTGVPFAAVKTSLEEYLRAKAIDDTLKNLTEEKQVVYFRPEENAAVTAPPLQTAPPGAIPADPPGARNDGDVLQ